MVPLRPIKQESSHLILAILNLGSQSACSQKREAPLVVIQLFLGYYFRMEWFAFQWFLQATESGIYVLCLFCYFTLSQRWTRKEIFGVQGRGRRVLVWPLQMLWVWAAWISFTFSKHFFFCYFLVTFHFSSALFDPQKVEMAMASDDGSFMASITLEVRLTDNKVPFGFKSFRRNPNSMEVNSKTSMGFGMVKISSWVPSNESLTFAPPFLPPPPHLKYCSMHLRFPVFRSIVV